MYIGGNQTSLQASGKQFSIFLTKSFPLAQTGAAADAVVQEITDK